MGKLARCRRGNVGIEVALTAPVLFVFVLGIAQFGRTMWLQSLLDYAVAEAARCASVNQTTCGTPSQIQNFAVAQSGNNFTAATFTVSSTGCGNQVSASYPLSFPLLQQSFSLTLSALACYPS